MEPHQDTRKSAFYDSKSLLSYGLQVVAWPRGFMMQQMILYDEKSNLKAFIMSFEAVI